MFPQGFPGSNPGHSVLVTFIYDDLKPTSGMTELSQYELDKFRKHQYFAVIEVGGQSINNQFGDAVKRLHKNRLYPVIIHDAQHQIDYVFNKKERPIKKIDGIRFTDTKEDLDLIIKTFGEVNDNLVQQLGDCAKGLDNIFHVDKGHPKYGRYTANKVIGMDKHVIRGCLMGGVIPVIPSFGRDENKQIYNINGEDSFSFAVKKLEPEKVINVTPSGGLHKMDDEIISEMNIKELREFIELPYIDERILPKVKNVLELAELGFDVQITNDLEKEIFTKEGSGTLIRAEK